MKTSSTVQTLIAALILTTVAACTNSARDSTGTQDTDGRGGTTTRDANPSPTPQSELVNPQGSSPEGQNPAHQSGDHNNSPSGAQPGTSGN